MGSLKINAKKVHAIMKLAVTILMVLATFSAFSQTGTFDYLTTNRRFTIAGRTVKGISNDSIWLIASADSLVTQYAVKGYVDNHFGPGTSNAYNFNPEQFIVSGYDVSIRFPQDPGEPLFTGSPSFNFTQQHLNFLDSLMLAVGEDTYLDDRDFYYSPDSLHPIRTKSFTLSTDGTGAASWDSVNKRLNIPVSSGGGGGSTGVYHLPYTGDSLDYIGGDTLPHHLPPTPPPGDSIDYSFTSMTTIYNEAGPGEYTISSSDLSFNKDNLINPFRQLKALDVGGWNDGSYVSFKNTGNVNSTAYTFLRGFVRLKQTVPIIQSLSFRFYNAGVPVSQIVSMVNYGLDKSKINTYQNITIPMSAFQFSSNTFDEVRLIFGGGSSTDGLYLDLFQFQNATVNENIYVTDVFRVPGTTQVKKILGGQTVDAYTDSVGIAVDTTPLHNQLVQQLSAIQANTASILLKLNISDTAAMLSPYASKIGANTLAIAGKEATIAAGTTAQYWRGDKTWQTLTTTAVAEGTNLYYTDTRARAAVTLTTTGTSGAASYNSTTGVLNVPQYAASVGTITWLGTTYNINSGNNITLATPTTSNISEGTNLYYTDARARAAISVTGSGTYNSTTGVINITGGSSSGWSTTGNTGGTNVFGLTSNNSLRVYTNNTQRMVIDSLGDVRIDGQGGATNALGVYGGNTLRFGVAGFGGVTTNGGTLTIGSNTLLASTRLTVNFPGGNAGVGVKNTAAGNYAILAQTSTGITTLAVGDSGLIIRTAAVSFPIVNTTATQTIGSQNYTVNVDATDFTKIITLPTAVNTNGGSSAVAGRVYIIRKSDPTSNTVTINTTSSQTINGSSTYVLSAQYQYVIVQSDGSNWMIIGKT